MVPVKIAPISTSEGCTRLWKPEIQFDGIFEGLGVQPQSVKEDALGFDPGVCEQVAGVPIPWDLDRMHLAESW